MAEGEYRWKGRQLRDHVAVIDGKQSPTKVLTNATYLNSVFRKWMKANIWVANDRIVYVGERMPDYIDDCCEIVDCKDYFIVPGYIEPHAHPFQLYNPRTFAHYAAQTGTTTLINDNLFIFFQQQPEDAFELLNAMHSLPITMYWWCRLDGQTEMQNEEQIFSSEKIQAWLKHEDVLQVGELTAWPRLLAGDDVMLHWMQEAKQLGKKIEAHLPGASEKTLAKLMLLGAGCDHESMTGIDVYNRLMQGYTTALRYSSIRPDLPQLLDEMKQLSIDCYDFLTMTTDGSSPAFYEQGIIDTMIRIAIEKGVPVIDAYNMATINIARYYNMIDLHGMIATGRIANINLLQAKENPTPISVLAKGEWIKWDGLDVSSEDNFPWEQYNMQPLHLPWELTIADLQFYTPFGMNMENSVITKPYSVSIDTAIDALSKEHDECFLTLIDREGSWRANVILKGFATHVDGFASSFSNTGDIIIIGKNKHSMIKAFERMKEIGGGIVLVDGDTVVHEIELTLNGIISKKAMPELMEEEKKLKQLLSERGYLFPDPVYTLLFLMSTHLPYIRITQRGIYDVMKKTILVPSVMR